MNVKVKKKKISSKLVGKNPMNSPKTKAGKSKKKFKVTNTFIQNEVFSHVESKCKNLYDMSKCESWFLWNTVPISLNFINYKKKQKKR